MADVIDFPRADDKVERIETDDQFLLREGLDLLAAFRTISDPLARAAVLTIVRSLAADGRAGATR